jgi:hypothetical protein
VNGERHAHLLATSEVDFDPISDLAEVMARSALEYRERVFQAWRRGSHGDTPGRAVVSFIPVSHASNQLPR